MSKAGPKQYVTRPHHFLLYFPGIISSGLSKLTVVRQIKFGKISLTPICQNESILLMANVDAPSDSYGSQLSVIL